MITLENFYWQGWILLDDGSLNHDIAFVYKLTIVYELLEELDVHE